MSVRVILCLRACAGVYYYVNLHGEKTKQSLCNLKKRIMDYEEMNDKMIVEQEDRRQVEGLVKLLWSGIVVAGVLIAVGIVMLLTACH